MSAEHVGFSNHKYWKNGQVWGGPVEFPYSSTWVSHSSRATLVGSTDRNSAYGSINVRNLTASCSW